MKHLMPLLSALLCVALSGCSIWQQQQQPERKEEERQMLPPQYLGTVHQVYPAQKFALLRIIGPMPSAGTTLITHPVDGSTSRMGNLVVASDTSPRGGMIAADIRSGVVAGGDRVFLYRNIAPPEPTTDKAPEEQAAAEAPPTLSPLRVYTTDGSAPAAPSIPEPAAAEPAVQEPAAAPAPTRTESTSPLLPSLPAEAPSYLKDIPDDVSQWN